MKKVLLLLFFCLNFGCINNIQPEDSQSLVFSKIPYALKVDPVLSDFFRYASFSKNEQEVCKSLIINYTNKIATNFQDSGAYFNRVYIYFFTLNMINLLLISHVLLILNRKTNMLFIIDVLFILL